MERATIFIFSLCTEFETQLNGSALGIISLNYKKKNRELLIGNSKFKIYNLWNQLLYYTNIKESYLYVAETVENLDLNN